MEHKVLRTAEKLQKSHTKKHWLYRGLSVLAAGAVFCTTYALILPAITLDKDAICGYDEHTHTDECYTSTGSWACMDNADTYEMLASADYVAHTHTDECYNESGEMICPFADWDNLVEPHEHTDECYQIVVHTHDENCMEMVQGELICTLDESDGHIHDEGCLGEVPVLICELPEHEFHTDDCYASDGNIICGLENHVHGDECYETELVNVCEIEEGEGQHTHTSTCYEYVTKPTCNIDEGTETAVLICDKIALHTHTDACYTDGALTCGQPEVILHQHDDCYVPGEPELTCEIEEHTHTDECYGTYEEVPGMYNSTADSSGVVGENAFEWYAKLPESTYNWATDLAAVAKSQVGYEEEADPTEEEPDRTYNIYSAYLETIYDDFVRSEASWDQIFVTWCLTVSDIEATEIPQPYTVEEFWEQAEYQGMLRMDEYTAGTGDIVILLKDDGNFRSGIVDCVDEDGIHVVLGDEDGAVVEQTVTSNDVIAWVSVQYQYNVHHPEQDAGDEITDVESYYNWQAMQDLAASGWFTYWADHPTLYEEETTVVQTTPPAEGEDTSPSSVQIDEKGGTTQYDESGQKVDDDGRVTVSKTIEGTSTENVFDITLTVTSDTEIKTLYEDPDIAIVIVMDISNTMASEYTVDGGMTKYQSAVEAAEKFVESFAEKTKGYSKIGFVAFNTDAHKICEMTSVSTGEGANTFKDTIRTETGKIINDSGYGVAHSRFTNMEAGLMLAGDMLKSSGNKHKFIVFLTDGLPTTYVSSEYDGYDPYTSSGEMGVDGVFADMLRDEKSTIFSVNNGGVYCGSGTSYSDKAAKRASVQARKLKNDGVTIFSVGVGLVFGDNKIPAEDYLKKTLIPLNTCVVDRGKYATDDEGNLIGSGIQNDYEYLEVVREHKTFGGETGWLGMAIASPKDTANPNGGGYYYDANNVTAINNAFTQIFEELSKKVEESAATAWIVTDPMNEEIKFLELLDDPKPNGATQTNGKITWDLKDSSVEPVKTAMSGDKTIYTYQLKYRVRLTNEDSKFVEGKIYDTNQQTTLTYQLRKTSGGDTTFTDIYTVDFPIPSVHGYLGELSFTKVSEGTDIGIPDAEFTLTHDPSCTLCTLTEATKNDSSYWSCITKTATSAADGSVAFSNIPSGHTYILEETEVPVGYTKNSNTYTVTVSYDTVTVTESDGSTTKTWGEGDYIIYNFPKPELPATGGTGTRRYILVGVLLMSTAVLLYTVRRRQRE